MFKRLMYLFSFILVLGLTTTVTSQDIADGLVAYWPLDEAGGTTTADLSGNGSDGTFVDAPVWVAGKFGSALDFDGSNDAVDCGNQSILDFGTDDFTISCWVNVGAEDNDEAIFGKGDRGGTCYFLKIRDGGGDIKLRLDDGSTQLDPDTDDHPSLYTAPGWHHLVAMRRTLDNKIHVYVDGVDDQGVLGHGDSDIPAGYDLSDTSLHNTYIGAIEDTPLGRFFDGSIDDVAVWNRALTAEEVTYLWNNGDGNTTALPEPEKASNPNPADRTTVDLADATPLSWTVGEYAVKHDVYFGTTFDDVNDADSSDTSGIYRGRETLPIYTPSEALELGETYYWRIDEVNSPPDNDIHNGKVWSFTVAEYLLVDDFEGYTDYAPNDIFSSWLDGYDIDENGALVGHDNPDFDAGEHFLETEIVHGGKQSLPFYYSNVGAATYSEAERAFTPKQDWTREGVKLLSLWFRGYPVFLGGFTEGPAGTYTMNAAGADIWNEADEFHFAYQELSGAGSIAAKIESVSDTHTWAKAGVMIRDTLDADSPHAMMVVTPAQGVSFQRRTSAGGGSDSDTQPGITAPQWVKLERTLGGLVRAYYSMDGNTWTQLGVSVSMTMNNPMYVGLALTSHNPGVVCEAMFSNVTSDGTGPWVSQDIGLLSNEAEPMYVTVEDGGGTTATVYHEDPNASQIDTWTQWIIELKELSDAGVILTDVNNLAIGFGDGDDPQPGGSGLVFFDDIHLRVEPIPEPEPGPTLPPVGTPYTYDGDTPDETWDHDNGSDQWDGTGPGVGNLGGAMSLTEEDVTFLRIQDTGDPRDYDNPDPGSNRKIYLTHTTDIGLDGAKLEFSIRVATTDPLDGMHPDGGGGATPWPADGVGYHIRDEGKGMIGISDGIAIISFSLAKTGEAGFENLASDVLVMNNLVGTEPSDDVDTGDAAAVAVNMINVEDATQWNTFVIDIAASGSGTHVVTVSANGGAAQSFDVTAGTGAEKTNPFIAVGSSGTGGITAFDVDYLSISN